MLPQTFDLLFESGKIAFTSVGSVSGLPNLDFDTIPDDWLAEANKGYRADSMPAKKRPLQALCDYTKQQKATIRFGSPAAESVFRWFKERSAPGAHRVGALFTGSYFYDAHFWPVSVLIGWGNVRLDALEALETMPPATKAELRSDPVGLRTYVLYWIDCVDYAFGYEVIRRGGEIKSIAMKLLNNADSELRAAVEQVSELRPNPHAAFSARMATELFLKTLLVEKAGYSERGLKKLGHDLDKLCEEAEEICNVDEFRTVKGLVHLFPIVNARYFGDDLKPAAVGKTISLCQLAATTVVRQFTDRDSRRQIL